MTRRILTRAVLYGSLAVLAACAEPPNLSPTDDQVADANETLTQAKDGHWALYEWPTVDDFVATGSSTAPALMPPGSNGGCAVGLAEQGEIIYLGVYGEARPGQQWDYGTVAPVGSVAKSFTALAAMTLTQMDDPDGDPYLALSARVGDVLSTSNGDLADARVDDLLSHASGVGGNSLALAFAPNWAPGTPVADCALMGSATACPDLSQLLALPSIAFAFYEPVEVVQNVSMTNGMYSNVGYSVVGAIVDQITGSAAGFATDEHGYEKFVWDRLANWTGLLDGRRMLSPALSHSWRLADGDFLRYARGYPFDNWDGLASFDPGLNDTAEIEGWEGPSGGWAMSIGDLTRFAMLFGNNAFIPAAVRNAMVQSLSQPLGTSNNFRWYGYGVFNNEDSAGDGTEGGFGVFKRWYHGGDIASHAAYWAHWPDISGGPFSAAVICNNIPAGGGSLTNLEPTVGWLLLNALRVTDDRPRLKTMIGLLPSAAEMNPAVYRMDLTAARFTAPRHFFLPLNEVAPLTLRLIARNFSDSVRVVVQPRRGDAAATVLAGLADRRNNELRSGPADIALSSANGQVVLRDAELKFNFSDDRTALVNATLSGTLDTRDLVRLAVVDDWGEACLTAQDLGSECGLCDDGVQACLAVSLTDIRATREH